MNCFDDLAELAYEALTTSGWDVDTNAMLLAANALLDEVQCGPGDTIALLGRQMANAAADWAIFMGDTSALRMHTRAFLAAHLAAVEAAAA